MAADETQRLWSFDISSLILLIGEGEELNYRLSRRSLLQCFAAAPVVGLQNYIRSYDLLLETGPFTYFSPYGCKSAPLRNARLSNAIRLRGLLEDGRYTVFRIPVNSQTRTKQSRQPIFLIAWIGVTWIIFAGLVLFLIVVPDVTWVGTISCLTLMGWSILLRLVEFANIKPAPLNIATVTDPNAIDSIFILGRKNSAFVLEGSRADIKRWTAQGLVYSSRFLGIAAIVWQTFTRVGSLLVLLLTFMVIPNGSTMDQVAFLFLNGIAQLNVIIGQRLHSQACLQKLEIDTDEHVESRTHVYAELLRRYKDADDIGDWVRESGLLPDTRIWEQWREEVVRTDPRKDSKALYHEIHARYKAESLLKKQ